MDISITIIPTPVTMVFNLNQRIKPKLIDINNNGHRDYIDKADVAEFSLSNEFFARSFAQYIALRSKGIKVKYE